jgi:voltage-gated potassium channel Kch
MAARLRALLAARRRGPKVRLGILHGTLTASLATDRTDRSPRILLIGSDELTGVTQRALRDAGAVVTNLRDPDDAAIRTALRHAVDTVVVISKDDHISLRSALIVEGVRPGVRLVVTVFDRDVALKLESAVRNVHVISMADIVVPSIAAACLDHSPLSLHRTATGLRAIRSGSEGPEIVTLDLPRRGLGPRLVTALSALLRPHELSAKILMSGLLGFLAILALDAVMTAAVLHEQVGEAIYTATKALVTVGPNTHVDNGPTWFKLFSAAMMLAGLAFTALFTAGVVNRLIDRRLIAIVGRRIAPRRDHVIVVGLGQVGLRLCLLLRELRVPVLAIESNRDADYVARARDYGLPVVIGRGGSRHLLKRVSTSRARALAAVTSDEIENIAIVVAAHSCREDLRTLLRAGRGEVTSETRSLLKLGVVRDVYRLGGTLIAAMALGSPAREAFMHEKVVYLVTPDGAIAPFAAAVSRAPAGAGG